MRGLQKVHLDEALRDCEQALNASRKATYNRQRKGRFSDSAGRHQDALETSDQALTIAPQQAASLYVRGYAKKNWEMCRRGRRHRRRGMSTAN